MLTAKHLADAISVLDAVEQITPNPNPAELGRLQARAIIAAINLRIHGGLDSIAIPVAGVEEAAQ